MMPYPGEYFTTPFSEQELADQARDRRAMARRIAEAKRGPEELEYIARQRRRMPWSVAVAIPLAFAAIAAGVLYLSYEIGGMTAVGCVLMIFLVMGFVAMMGIADNETP